MKWETFKKLFSHLIELPVMPPKLTENSQRLYDLAKSCLDKDIAATQNELGCAEAVSYLLHKLKVPGFPMEGFLGTGSLEHWLEGSEAFVEVFEWLPGDIIMSATGTSTKGAKHGHVGICGYHGVMSNNSMNGLWQQYYTDHDWKTYYHDRLGFPVRYFRFK